MATRCPAPGDFEWAGGKNSGPTNLTPRQAPAWPANALQEVRQQESFQEGLDRQDSDRRHSSGSCDAHCSVAPSVLFLPERTETILLTPSMTVRGSWRRSVEHCRSNSTLSPSAPGVQKRERMRRGACAKDSGLLSLPTIAPQQKGPGTQHRVGRYRAEAGNWAEQN